MCSCAHEYKVCDSHLRSFLIVATGNGLEYVADFIFLHFFMDKSIPESLGGSVALVVICYITSFIALRIWNRTRWGRKVVDVSVNRN